MYNFGHPVPYSGHMSFFGSNYGLLGGLLGLVAWVVIIGIVIAVLVAITRHGRRTYAMHHAGVMAGGAAPQPTNTPAEDEALRIARERLARGEIDPEQYRAIVEALSM